MKLTNEKGEVLIASKLNVEFDMGSHTGLTEEELWEIIFGKELKDED